MGQLNFLDPDQPAPQPKADTAYKNISEVADILGVPQHVLRFWENNFPQLSPSRMRGSRRYYRPEDVAVLQNIKTLLYTKGYTIKGARKLLSGKHVSMDDVETLPVAEETLHHPAPPEHSAQANVDLPLLINELRVLKSMLKTLL